MSWIITGKEAGSLGLLDQYGDAAAAYSLRNLSLYNTDPVVRVRRDNDNSEADFTATEVSDGTLAAWVGAGNDGFVRTWYDQSGNARHAEQATMASQPQIVATGSLLTENGKASLSFNGTSNYLTAAAFSVQTTDISLVSVFKFNALMDFQTFISFGSFISSGFLFQRPDSDTYRYATNGGFTDYGSNLNTNQTLLELYDKSNGATEVFRNTVLTGQNSQSTAINGSNVFEIGRRADTSAQYTNMNAQEFILYPSNQSSNRVGIEANINAHYSIY